MRKWLGHSVYTCVIVDQLAHAVVQAIINHGNLGVLHGTSAIAPATIVAPAYEAEVPNRLLGALDSSEFIFGRSMGRQMSLFVRDLSLKPLLPYIVGSSSQGPCLRLARDSLGAAKNARKPKPDRHKEDEYEGPVTVAPRRQRQRPFPAATSVKAHRQRDTPHTHRARCCPLLGSQQPHWMFTLAACREGYQASQNQRYKDQNNSRVRQ